jgi:hypothetical protein
MPTILNIKRCLFRAGLFTTAVAAHQAVQTRNKYVEQYKLAGTPDGPAEGRAQLIDIVKNEIKRTTYTNLLKMTSMLTKLFMKKNQEASSAQEIRNDSELKKRRIKLIIVGDSLVCGIGCRKELVLPRVIAETLSRSLQADVSWSVQGINGGSTLELRNLLPKVAQDFKSPIEIKEEVFVIVICGLNDWKQVLFNFPFGAGQVNFKQDLNKLLADIKDLTDGQCRVFLPALPLVCGYNDSRSL